MDTISQRIPENNVIEGSYVLDRHLTKAMVVDGWAICPRCRKKLARVYYGASCHGIELFCKRCEMPLVLELR